MYSWLSRQLRRAYEQVLRREIGEGPTHVGIIQDGNRRYARKQGDETPEGHRAGASTSEQVLNWCEQLDIAELTLYAFSTENFDRPPEEREPLFDIIESKLYELADSKRVHDTEVRIRAIGEIDRLPDRVQEAITYAEAETADYDRFRLNVALAYGGRNELLRATREATAAVDAGELALEEIDVETVESHLYRQPIRDVDLIIRTGGDERTSNFLPWHANGNEAAVYFCAPYWPEFSKVDFLRGIRTYEAREESWQQTKVDRAVTLIQALGEVELTEARGIGRRLHEQLPGRGLEEVTDELPTQHSAASEEPTETEHTQTKPAD
ncbi:tritrans,polycis-undecaprenyl-diphosphate synthase [geranylgeranyl-diphosphate specific] [Halohasta litchfieldiae]|jgi:tritrans,polycis-undecaprenyl-diphosphate synthase [geranylgeranyl-diphosphate specific]|uniref:Tritrans,polycis-undecaprenyl-diphosphate synthase (geranylgeranyl-diphosphate specific) n=1 Tax=Halohasta litchfieldiae TaxID=1073996 RepID=A0A1H6XDN1_9EURY|nr:polyprenyl diphosphate synthase [Halohasta litchfieldiae]ATW88305.1 tritrans,polycis-undecaprenyl-diphosphate synthase [geranylgeranyl-diphosphate specific] [Halohasta litchfieldiae]SEJ27259.1 Undecaprenyl pyrophosphate synthetase [Halohasta litchfieldiae]